MSFRELVESGMPVPPSMIEQRLPKDVPAFINTVVTQQRDLNKRQTEQLAAVVLSEGVPLRIRRNAFMIADYPWYLAKLILTHTLPVLSPSDISDIASSLLPDSKTHVAIAHMLINYGLEHPSEGMSAVMIDVAIKMHFDALLPVIVFNPTFVWTPSVHIMLRNHNPELAYPAASGHLGVLKGFYLNMMIEELVNRHEWKLLDELVDDPRMNDPAFKLRFINVLVDRAKPENHDAAMLYALTRRIM